MHGPINIRYVITFIYFGTVWGLRCQTSVKEIQIFFWNYAVLTGKWLQTVWKSVMSSPGSRVPWKIFRKLCPEAEGNNPLPNVGNCVSHSAL